MAGDPLADIGLLLGPIVSVGSGLPGCDRFIGVDDVAVEQWCLEPAEVRVGRRRRRELRFRVGRNRPLVAVRQVRVVAERFDDAVHYVQQAEPGVIFYIERSTGGVHVDGVIIPPGRIVGYLVTVGVSVQGAIDVIVLERLEQFVLADDVAAIPAFVASQGGVVMGNEGEWAVGASGNILRHPVPLVVTYLALVRERRRVNARVDPEAIVADEITDGRLPVLG